MCYFQLDGEQAKFSNRLSLDLKSSSPPPPCPAPTACRHGESKCVPGTPLRAICSLFLPGALLALLLPKNCSKDDGSDPAGGSSSCLPPSHFGLAQAAAPAPPRHVPAPTGTRVSISLCLCTFMHAPTCSLLAFPQAEIIPPSSSPQIPPFCHPLSPLLLRPLQKCSCFRSRVLALLEMQEEIHVQLTVSAPCNHFVSRKALLSNPHRKTGRGRVGERHLTPACAFLPPFLILGFAVRVGQELGFPLLSLPGCFGSWPGRGKGIRQTWQNSGEAGENASPSAGFA